MDFRHGGNNVRVGQGIADAPACHGIGLGKAVQQDGAVLHLRQPGKADMPLAAVGQVTVDFIGNYNQVMLYGKAGNGNQLLSGKNGSCRIVWVADEQCLGLVSDMRLQILRRDAEVVLDFCRYRHRHATSQGCTCLVGHIARLRNEDFIPWCQDGTHGNVQSFADAYGHQHIGLWLIVNIEVTLLQGTDFLTELQQSSVGSIGGVALFQAVDTAFPDGPWRNKVRLAHAQGNNILHLRSYVKEAADAASFLLICRLISSSCCCAAPWCCTKTARPRCRGR